MRNLFLCYKYKLSIVYNIYLLKPQYDKNLRKYKILVQLYLFYLALGANFSWNDPAHTTSKPYLHRAPVAGQAPATGPQAVV